MKPDIKKFLQDLKLMITETGTEFAALWKQVPSEYQEGFKSWVNEYKQQTWDDNSWHRAWNRYGFEYISSVIDYVLEELG